MSKTVAIIASLDTKAEDIIFLKNLINNFGYKTFIIDVGIKMQTLIKPQITAVDVAKEADYFWDYPINVEKSEFIEVMKQGIAKLITKLYSKNKFNAVISLGGLQNTTIAVNAMKELPIGIPKVMVSTMASGKRPFELIVGYSDIIPVPSLADFSGGNIVTNTILRNAAAAIAGMVEKAGAPIRYSDEMLIGITAMGVVNGGAEIVIKELKGKGYEVVSFHSTGVGGKIMDRLIDQEVIKASVEFSLHEIVAELFGGYSKGADNRLIVSGEKGIPQVVVPGGCDFIDFEASVADKSMFKRKYKYHNSDVVHFKLLNNEVIDVGKTIAIRLNYSKGPVTVVIPLQGFREGARKGEPLYDPEIDNLLIQTLKNNLKKEIDIIEVDANINDEVFGLTVSREMLKMLN